MRVRGATFIGARSSGDYTTGATPCGWAALCWARAQLLFRILPRSRHLPVAVTEGSLTENTNEIGVRLWTDPSLI